MSQPNIASGSEAVDLAFLRTWIGREVISEDTLSVRHARLMARESKYHDALQDALVNTHHMQVPVWSVAGKPERLIRLSAQIYNSRAQYEYLAEALAMELERERRM